MQSNCYLPFKDDTYYCIVYHQGRIVCCGTMHYGHDDDVYVENSILYGPSLVLLRFRLIMSINYLFWSSIVDLGTKQVYITYYILNEWIKKLNEKKRDKNIKMY